MRRGKRKDEDVLEAEREQDKGEERTPGLSDLGAGDGPRLNSCFNRMAGQTLLMNVAHSILCQLNVYNGDQDQVLLCNVVRDYYSPAYTGNTWCFPNDGAK
ncbi:hypothetical protein EJB05_23901, partial [Eragrostis curvula]